MVILKVIMLLVTVLIKIDSISDKFLMVLLIRMMSRIIMEVVMVIHNVILLIQWIFLSTSLLILYLI